MLVQSYKERWSKTDKLLFRFLFSYFTLYILLMFSSPLFEIPFRWVGSNLFGFKGDFEVSGNGSGDNTYAYITLFIGIILSVISTVTWTIADQKRKAYNKLFYWFLFSLRIFLIGAMYLYGFVKVFQIQFQPPTFLQLLQPLGEFSPMGLAWTYMGFSKGFGMFAGIMEVLGGLLLIWRRTSTLGAFIIIGVMAQVAMMNFSFDIPVKLFSIHIILMAGVLFLTDLRRFTNVFIKNKAVSSYKFYYPSSSNERRKTVATLKKIIVPTFLVIASILGYLGELNVSDINHRPTFYGVWEVDTFIKDSVTIAPLISDNQRWRYLVIQRKGNAAVKTMDDKIIRYDFNVDTLSQQLTMSKTTEATDSLNFSYTYTKNKHLRIQGQMHGTFYNVLFTKKAMDSVRLMSRGFHWINEIPYAR